MTIAAACLALIISIIVLIQVLGKDTRQMACFSKVSYAQFRDDYETYMKAMGEPTPYSTVTVYNSIVLPKRATSGSAGYDFYSPTAFILHAGESITLPTGVNVDIDSGWVLQMYPRSSMGFKYNVVLANTVGIIDSDYIDGENEGHIWIKLVNNGDKDMVVCRGDRIAQGVFVPYGITYDDTVSAKRTGGFGSTN